MSVASNLLLNQVVNNGLNNRQPNSSISKGYNSEVVREDVSEIAKNSKFDPFAKFHKYYEFHRLGQIAVEQAQYQAQDFDPFSKPNQFKV